MRALGCPGSAGSRGSAVASLSSQPPACGPRTATCHGVRDLGFTRPLLQPGGRCRAGSLGLPGAHSWLLNRMRKMRSLMDCSLCPVSWLSQITRLPETSSFSFRLATDTQPGPSLLCGPVSNT